MKNILLFALLILSNLSFSQKVEKTELSNEEKLYGLSLIWQEVNYNFAYLHDSGINWDSLYIATIPKVENTKSIEEYYDVLNQFICVFHEGHTLVINPKGMLSEKGVVSISIFYTNGAFYVGGYSKEYSEKIKLGSKIEEINEISTLKYFEENIYPKYNIPKPTAYNYLGFKLFYGPISEKLKVKFQNPDGKYVTLILERKVNFDKLDSVNPEIVGYDEFSFKKINDIAYIHIDNFQSDEINKKFDKIVDSLMLCKGIIIDLRYNSGGNSQFGEKICQYFTNDSIFETGSVESKINSSYYRALGKLPFVPISQNQYIEYASLNKFETQKFSLKNKTKGVLTNIPLVVLINPNTSSAAESFLITLKKIKNGVTIGLPSYGSTTLPLIVSLPGGGQVYIASQRTLDENGKPYKITMPDILVEPTVANRIDGKDVILERALEYLKTKK